MCRMALMMSRPTWLVSGVPLMVTMPFLTVTVNRSESHRNVPRIRSWGSWRCMSVSDLLYTLRTTARVTMPISVPGDREPLNPPVEHQAGRVGDRPAGADGHRRLSHQVGRGDRVHPCPHALPGQALQRPGHGAFECFLGQQVGFGDDPDDLVVLVYHGECADPLLVQHGRHLLVWGALPDGDHVGAHYVLDGDVHGVASCSGGG